MNVRAVLGLVAVCLVSACSGDAPVSRRDPFPASATAEGALPLFSEGIDGVEPVEPGGPPQFFRLSLSDTCIVATIGDAHSECMNPRPGPTGTMSDGGIHDGVSAAWLTTGDADVSSARFWMLDGTTFDQDPILADGVTDPPVVFGHAVAATNEIVGVELLDADGNVIVAIAIDGTA